MKIMRDMNILKLYDYEKVKKRKKKKKKLNIIEIMKSQ